VAQLPGDERDVGADGDHVGLVEAGLLDGGVGAGGRGAGLGKTRLPATMNYA
jgi:hypothetical protein